MQLRLRALPALTVLILLGPVIAGLFGTVSPALGVLPDGRSAMEALFDWPGLWSAVRVSVTTGLLATAVSLTIVALITAGWHGTRAFAWLERLLSPLLAVPHAAAAFGLAFLIAPSGWLARLVSPGLSGWDRPPDLLIVQDPLGLTMTAGLIAKEVPFLLLMTLAALGQTQSLRSRLTAEAMGYGRATGWLKTVFPLVYAQIRLPVYVVLAYSMTVVDVAVILGPNTPPSLSAQIVRWMSDPDLSLRRVAAAGALLQFGLVLLAIGAWWAGERLVARAGLAWIAAGSRGRFDQPLRGLGLSLGAISALAVIGGLAGLALWSVAGAWRFPSAIPEGLTLRNWARHGPGVSAALWDTAVVALCSVFIALFLTLGCLEAEYRYRYRATRRVLLLLYLPLLVPQIAFLPGLQMLLLNLRLESGLLPVILVHVIFVLPYVFLSLSDPFRAWEPRYGLAASTLGASPDRILWAVRLPMMLRPVLIATAVGLAVSVGQYLPTLLIGGGRVQTLTTEGVALASGGDRRAIGVYGIAQTGAALLPFALATILPLLIWRNRRGLSHG